MRAAIRLFGVAAVVVSAVMASAVGAFAAPPSSFDYDVAGTYTVTELCDFPVEVTYRIVGVTTAFSGVDEDGTGRYVNHSTARDTFTANGITLVGEPYRGTHTLTMEDFEQVASTYVGVLEKVRLPDGSIFMAAGRIDLLATDQELPLVPDHGVVKNQDAFCAALSA